MTTLEGNIKKNQRELNKLLLAHAKSERDIIKERNALPEISSQTPDEKKKGRELNLKLLAVARSVKNTIENRNNLGEMLVIIPNVAPKPGTTITQEELEKQKKNAESIKEKIIKNYAEELKKLNNELDKESAKSGFPGWNNWAISFQKDKYECGISGEVKHCYEVLKAILNDSDFQDLVSDKWKNIIGSNDIILQLNKKLTEMKLV